MTDTSTIAIAPSSQRVVSDSTRAEVRGVWLPLVTPFKDSALDEVSLKRLLRHVSARPVDGLVGGATTGEGPLLDERELERLAKIAAEELGDLLPIYLGVSSSDTAKLAQQLKRIA